MWNSLATVLLLVVQVLRAYGARYASLSNLGERMTADMKARARARRVGEVQDLEIESTLHRKGDDEFSEEVRDAISLDLQASSTQLSTVITAFHHLQKRDDLDEKENKCLDDNWLFAECDMVTGIEYLLEFTGDPHALTPLGKLTKGNNFFRTRDRRWLMKELKGPEAEHLQKLSRADIPTHEYEGCATFTSSLLLPLYVTFTSDGDRPFAVMLNETSRLERLVGSRTSVSRSYDLKPLPNLAADLAYFTRELQKEELAKLPILQSWLGWDTVMSALKQDARVLGKYSSVDFSLFIHVLTPTVGPTIAGDSSLGSEKGCIQAPGFEAMICFRIIDFVTPLTLARSVESWYKHDKFKDYSVKFSRMLDCLGDLDADGCAGYKSYDDILAAGDAGEKVSLVRSDIFSERYECKAQSPDMQYSVFMPGPNPTFMQSRFPGESYATSLRPVLKDVEIHAEFRDLPSHEGYSRTWAHWFQNVFSPEAAARVVKDDYKVILRAKHNHSKEDATAMSKAPFGMTEPQIDACIEGIETFATETWFSSSTRHESLGNVVFSPSVNKIFVVRGVPSLYSHSDSVNEMRRSKCFLQTTIYSCQPWDNKEVVFDYKHKFGSFEILSVDPGRYSGSDFRIWAEAVEAKRLSATQD